MKTVKTDGETVWTLSDTLLIALTDEGLDINPRENAQAKYGSSGFRHIPVTDIMTKREVHNLLHWMFEDIEKDINK